MSSAQRKLYKLLPSWFVLSRNSKISDITNNVLCDKAERSSLQEQQLFSAASEALLELLHCCRKTTPSGKSCSSKSVNFVYK